MCSACEGKPIEERVAADPKVIDRARAIEATMTGERVPEEAWKVFFGLAGGSVTYQHYVRIHAAYERAEQSSIRLSRGLRRAVAPASWLPRPAENNNLSNEA
jgi:hypothetical protein